MLRLLVAIPLIIAAIHYGKPYLDGLTDKVTIKVVGFDLPKLSAITDFPIRVQLHNPTIIPVTVTNLIIQVHKQKDNQWLPVANTGELAQFTLQSGDNIIPVIATINFQNIWGNLTDQLAYFTVGQSFLITATAKVNGIAINYEEEQIARV